MESWIVRRLLVGANTNLKTEAADFHYSKLQIEHVMPQKWREHWPLTGTTDAEQLLEAQSRDQVLHQFGNLTLVGLC